MIDYFTSYIHNHVGSLTSQFKSTNQYSNTLCRD